MQIHFHSLLWSYLPRVAIILTKTVFVNVYLFKVTDYIGGGGGGVVLVNYNNPVKSLSEFLLIYINSFSFKLF